VCIVVKVLSGTGVGSVVEFVVLAELPPDAELLDEVERVVPASEVLALEEMLEVVLVLERIPGRQSGRRRCGGRNSGGGRRRQQRVARGSDHAGSSTRR
jgi:hypothetical protein